MALSYPFSPCLLFQTVASLRVSEFLLFIFYVLGSGTRGTKNVGTLLVRFGSQASICSLFPPTASYQQGVLSATILYEILLGKATLYAVLVSSLVLMAMVRRRVRWGR
jgi:hypothetical protein